MFYELLVNTIDLDEDFDVFLKLTHAPPACLAP